jgi:hypothetical protein
MRLKRSYGVDARSSRHRRDFTAVWRPVGAGVIMRDAAGSPRFSIECRALGEAHAPRIAATRDQWSSAVLPMRRISLIRPLVIPCIRPTNCSAWRHLTILECGDIQLCKRRSGVRLTGRCCRQRRRTSPVYALQGLMKRRAAVTRARRPLSESFLGRDRELAPLHECLAHAAQGHDKWWVLGGNLIAAAARRVFHRSPVGRVFYREGHRFVL